MIDIIKIGEMIMKLNLNLKKLIFTFFIICSIMSHSSFVFATSKEPILNSQAAILMDAKTGKILYEKNANNKMYPASTTKILTAILAIENCNLKDVATVSYDAIMSIPEGFSMAELKVDEKITVEHLLEALLLYSANDAANVLAEHIGGSLDSFASMMNTKVHELGLTQTHFTNAFGMHHENHYSSAHDLAILMQYCMKNETFRILASKASCVIPATNKSDLRNFVSTNALILPNAKNYYPYATCGKTGFTSQAGYCLVSCSYKDNLELISVVLGGDKIKDSSLRFAESKSLFEYGYANYSIQTLLGQNDIVTPIEVKNGSKDTKNLDLLASSSLEVLLENSFSKDNLSLETNLKENIKAPIGQGEVLGMVSCTIDGKEYKTDLIASHSVEKSKLLNYMIEIGLGLLILILILVYYIYFHKDKS